MPPGGGPAVHTPFTCQTSPELLSRAGPMLGAGVPGGSGLSPPPSWRKGKHRVEPQPQCLPLGLRNPNPSLLRGLSEDRQEQPKQAWGGQEDPEQSSLFWPASPEGLPFPCPSSQLVVTSPRGPSSPPCCIPRMPPPLPPGPLPHSSPLSGHCPSPNSPHWGSD